MAVASFDEVKFDKLMGKWIVICPEREQQMSILHQVVFQSEEQPALTFNVSMFYFAAVNKHQDDGSESLWKE